MIRLLVALVVLAEIASFVLVGQAVGVLMTLLLVVAAALGGAALLRRGGGDAVRSMQEAMRQGRDPRPALLRGGFRVVAALLLVVPGFFGDAVALLLLLPPVQRVVAAALARRGLQAAGAATLHRSPPSGARPASPVDFPTSGFPAPPPRATPAAPVEDAEWEELSPSQRPTHRPSGWTRH